MRGFSTIEARSAFTSTDERKMESEVKALVDNFNAVSSSNGRYFAAFVICEGLNLLALLTAFGTTNAFLGGKYASYGFDVLSYYTASKGLQESRYDPICEVFPTKASCTIAVIKANNSSSINCVFVASGLDWIFQCEIRPLHLIPKHCQ